ncbi:MAG: hypothetical protein HFI79_11085 [Lachnospiraceae bacterium]|jgi:hypothetical protein|nr:hypothetical protein [Lachnospiraceae bacterium]
MGKESVSKREVEELLGCSVTEARFAEALEYAKKKQAYIYGRDGRGVTLQHWYLVRLTMEYVRNLAFSEFTQNLCRDVHDMEKEHPTNSQGAPTSTHIITGSAL